MTETERTARIDLHWIPLGAGQRVVRTSGRIFEAASALVQRRRPCDLYHSALTVNMPDGRFVIEMAPVVDRFGTQRGVVGEGPVGTRWAGRYRVFRYEIRCWRDGIIPDADYAIDVVSIDIDPSDAQRLLDQASSVPTPVWGRDECKAGEMWNSNSVTSWLLNVSGVDTSQIALPSHGRAPGWDAGRIVATRSRSEVRS